MNTQNIRFARRLSAVAVHAALLTLVAAPAAYAADAAAVDPAVAELVQPTNSIEIGAGATSQASAKFGEYNGLDHKGGFGVGNFDLRGGTAYDSNKTNRWSATGTDLGLGDRSFQFEYGDQGLFRFNLGYDELQRNKSDTYQTPFLGVGTNHLTLPSNWIAPILPRVSGSASNARGLDPTVSQSPALVSGVLTAPTAGQLATSAALQGADLPAFHSVDIRTKRTRYDLGAEFHITPQWDLSASYRHEDKDGLKEMGTVTRFPSEVSQIIPDLIKQSTEQMNAALGYHSDKGFFQAAYYGSLFTNNVPSMTWATYASAGGATSLTMSSAPDNQFHQFSLTGGYFFTPATKLVVNGSYARSTQNAGYLNDASTPYVPVNSLDGLIVTTAFNAKLTSKPTKGLNLTASYKYDERDNRTPVNIYGFYDASDVPASSNLNAGFSTALGVAANALASNINLNANRPYSKKLNELNFDADYQLTSNQAVKGGLDYTTIDRWCDGTWISCVDAAKTKESSLNVEWRGKNGDGLSGRVGYTRSHRTVDDYNENAFLAIVPMANVVPTGATASAYATMLALGWTGYGPAAGLPVPALTGNAAFFFANNNALSNQQYANQNRISELIGMRRYNMADRNRDKLRSSLNWQANEQLSLQAGLSYNNDDYSNSIYGLQGAKTWALNLDATYSPTEDLSASLFYTYEDQKTKSAGNTYTANSTATSVNGNTAISGGCFATIALRNASNKIDPCLDWSNDMRDKVDTVGLAVRQKNLAHNRLDVGGEVVFSRARSDTGVTGGSYVNNPLAVTGAPAGTIAAYYIPATAFPTVTTNTTQLRLNAKYALDKSSSVRVGYTYAHMTSVDWAYDGFQSGGLAGALPTFEQAPSYTVHVIAVAYSYTFR